MTERHIGARAPTVEMNATVDGVEGFTYMVGGSCALRSYYGFNKQTPTQVIRGMVLSGCGGCVMILTDVYEKGAKAEAFAKFVEENSLGTVTITPPSHPNPYTGSTHVVAIFSYDRAVLAKFVAGLDGKDAWAKPEGWHSTFDSVHMDSEFYQYGGRAKPAERVTASGIRRHQEQLARKSA